MTGTIKRMIRARGFGFITDEDGQEVFFHRSELVNVDFDDLNEGDEVTFEVEQSPKGLRAARVQPAE